MEKRIKRFTSICNCPKCGTSIQILIGYRQDGLFAQEFCSCGYSNKREDADFYLEILESRIKMMQKLFDDIDKVIKDSKKPRLLIKNNF